MDDHPRAASVPDGVTSLIADRHDQDAFERAIANAQTDWDLAIDCIGFGPADAQQDIATLNGRTPHLVFISTDFVYDPARRLRFPQTEETQYYLSKGYGGLKRQCELALLNSDPGGMVWTAVRPCHIYGPGSKLGCLPLHSRDEALIARLKARKPIELVGGGRFLQQPIFARDLSRVMLSMAGNEKCYRQIFCTAGPDIIESREYYYIIARALGVPCQIQDVALETYTAQNPDKASFLCHRIYDLGKLRRSGAYVPDTPIEQGLAQHVKSLIG